MQVLDAINVLENSNSGVGLQYKTVAKKLYRTDTNHEATWYGMFDHDSSLMFIRLL
jgi:hypothetical protein